MKKETPLGNFLKKTASLKDRKLARKIRISILDSMIKNAEMGVLQQFKGTPIEYKTREHMIAERGGDPGDRSELYDLGPEHNDSDISTQPFTRSLSTRYSPDRVGVQARRVSDGVWQDPITNKIYNWNEGFSTENGEEFSGGRVSLQTDIVYRK